MNFAILNKVIATKGSPIGLITEYKSIISLLHPVGLAETAFYLSATSPQIYYMLTFWYQLPSQEIIAACNRSRPLQEIATQAKMLDTKIFKLNWEYRRCDITVDQSHLCLITLPENQALSKAQSIINEQHRMKHSIPEVIGWWYGITLNENPGMVLCRIDWANVAMQQVFLKRETMLNMHTFWRQDHMKIEYASFNLQGLVQPEEIL